MTRFQAAGGKGEFRGRLDIEAICGLASIPGRSVNARRRPSVQLETDRPGIEAIYGRTLATKALGSDKALRLLRPQAGLQQVRVADLPGTPAEGHSSLLVLDHSKLNH